MKDNKLPTLNQEWTLLHPVVGLRHFEEKHTRITKKIYFQYEPIDNFWEDNEEAIDSLTDQRIKSILTWFTARGLAKLYIEYQTSSDLIKDNLPKNGWVHWSNDMIETLPLCDIDIVYMRDTSGKELLATESWDNIFISPSTDIPEQFTKSVK